MATILFPSPIFGPIHSRRLGISLGINLMPADGKVCNFDCIYCECGFNGEHRPHLRRPSREEVRKGLERQLQQMQAEGRMPDVLTFAGNGEPTAHPDFPQIIDDTIALRDAYCPGSKVSVLCNAVLAGRPAVREALLKVDNNILKLDTVSAEYIERINRPAGKYSVEETVQALAAFQGKCIVQTMFMKGEWEGRSVDNTGDEYVLPWLEAVVRIRPRQAMIYTIDRETPATKLQKATREELDRIAALVKAAGVDVSVSY